MLVPVTRKRVKMAPYRGKGVTILHLSYLENEFGDTNFFFCVYYEHFKHSLIIHKLIGKSCQP